MFNLREALLQEHSRAACDRIVAWVGGDQKRFDQLVKLFLEGEPRVTQRAAWPVAYAAQAHPFLIKKKLEAMVTNLQRENLHDAVKRNTVRILQHVEIPEELQGQVMDICFRYLESPGEAVAIKAFSLTVLGNLAKSYPDILPEIKLLVESQLPNQTAAFKSRAKQFLQ